MKPTVFIDMDGVVADCAGGVLRRFGILSKRRNEIKHFGDVPRVVNEFRKKARSIREDLFMDEIAEAGADHTNGTLWPWVESWGPQFWVDLKPDAHYEAIKHALQACKQCRFAFLTAPTGPNSVEGKTRWAGQHFPDVPVIPTHHKDLCAHPRAMLIDDADHNIEAFTQDGGGWGILAPQPWNKKAGQDLGPELLESIIESVFPPS